MAAHFKKSDLVKAAEACCRRFRSGKRGPGKFTGHAAKRSNKSMNVFESRLPSPETLLSRSSVEMGGKNGSPQITVTDEHNPHEMIANGSMMMEVMIKQYDDKRQEFYDNFLVAVYIQYSPGGSSVDIGLLSVKSSGQKLAQFTLADDGQPIGCMSAADVARSIDDDNDLVPLKIPRSQRPWTDFESRLVTEALLLIQDVDGGANRRLPPITATRLNGDHIVVNAHPAIPKGEVRGGSIQAQFKND